MKNTIGIKNPFGALRRAIVGIVDGAAVPTLHKAMIPTLPQKYLYFFKQNAGKPFPEKYVEEAKKELENFVGILEGEDVIVDRPDKIDFSKPFITPHWSEPSGLYAAMPRDILLVVKNKIIVAPMSWRCRYREIEAYLDLLTRYKEFGYEIVIAPRPELKDDLYEPVAGDIGDTFEPVLNGSEPVFDAADFIVLDKIIIGQKSLVTNDAGINWLKREVSNDFKIYILKFNDPHPMHIDATFLPLREGLILINPERVDAETVRAQLPTEIKSWEFVEAPFPVMKSDSPPRFFSSDWLNMNILMLNLSMAIVEENQTPLITLLGERGIKAISCPFQYFQCFGGSFHCAVVETSRL